MFYATNTKTDCSATRRTGDQHDAGRNLVQSLGVTAMTLASALLAGCAHDEPPPPMQTVRVVVDFSDSALEENGSDVNAAARNDVADLVNTVEPGTTIEIVGFSNRPGQECDPLALDFPPQDNPESTKQLREDVASQLPDLWQTYGDCLRDSGTGMPDGGSGIFGATVLAATTDTEGLVEVAVYTDGCTWGELAPGAETCNPSVLDRATGPKNLVSRMPAALKPPISVPIEFVLLGRGTNLSAPQLLALRRTFALWGTSTGSQVTFRN